MPDTRRALRRVLLTVSFALAAASGPVPADWHEVETRDGIRLEVRPVPGQGLPEFRATAVVRRGLDQVAAVIEDVDRHSEWVHACIESRLLAAETEQVGYVYNRMEAPWPVSDRDAVLRTEKVTVVAGREIHFRFRAVEHPAQPLVPGVVRMPRLEGHYRLEALGPEQTRVEYQVNADPGGRLPSVIARRATRELPLRTLAQLREEAARRGQQ